MAKFDLSNYATVAERLALFHADYPDGRIVTKWLNRYDHEAPRTWVVKASIYLTAGDQANDLPKATGLAVEIDGTGGANNGSALENAESSSVGRALMLAGYAASKNGQLASREEMTKVARIEATDWEAELTTATDIKTARALYARAMSQGAPANVLERIKAHGASLATQSES